MATQTSPAPEGTSEKAPHLADMLAQPHFLDQDEQKENRVDRKAMPPVPASGSGRFQGAPMSPVKINVQPEDWLPRSFALQVEGVKSTKEPVKNGSTGQEQHASNSSQEEGIIGETRHRQNFTAHPAQPVREHQVAVLSSVDNGRSRFPWEDSSLGSLDDEQVSREPSASGSETLDASEMVADVQPLQYHHLEQDGERMETAKGPNRDLPAGHKSHDSISSDRLVSTAENGRDISRHLTPSSLQARRSAIPRPGSDYSALSDPDHRGHSPGHISNSPTWRTHSPGPNLLGRSPDGRPNSSFIDLLNVPYQQQAPPPPINFDNSQLRTAVGSNASLLSTARTLEMYRMNAKKTKDPSIQYAFAIFLISAAREAGLNMNEPAASSSGKASGPGTVRDLEGPAVEKLDSPSTALDLLREARQLLSKLANRNYPFAEYYLADGYASGLFNKGREDYDRAFPLFVAASKHGHAESGYRAALCYEFGWGCRKDPAKALQFYRQSASKNHPGAMTRLGRACLSRDLGLTKDREGITWLKRATDAADAQYNTAPFYLGHLYTTGYGNDIFLDETYAAQLFTQAADLGHAEASFRLGEAYEHGYLSCPRDPALSVHFYTGAANLGHPVAQMALCAWYLVGAEPILEKDESEAYEWARRAAELGYTKAEYAVGYFTEMGIGCRRDPLEANVWYVRAADAGDERASYRLAAIRAAAAGEAAADPKKKVKKSFTESGIDKTKGAPETNETGTSPKTSSKDDKECIVM